MANYPGVTVEQRMGLMAGVGRDDLTLIDLPGVYSLTPYSEDARVAVDVLKGKMPGTPKPDAVLLVLDSLHLTRQLMLAAPVLALGLPTLVLLNMSDLMEVARRQNRPAEAGAGTGRAGGADQRGARNGAGSGSAVSQSTFEWCQARRNGNGNGAVPQSLILPVLGNAASTHTWAAQVSRRTGYRAPLSAENSRQARQCSAAPGLGTAAVPGGGDRRSSRWSSRSGSRCRMDFGDVLARAGRTGAPAAAGGWLQSLLLDGAWKGISSVLVFLPQILLLFLFIGVLEDSGYLARAALIADRVMRTTGLNGKAFIPLLSAYACAVPAIMATRTIENKRDRFATILVTPFMTCSARLPVYMLLIAAFIPNITYLHGFLGLRTLVMLGLYRGGLCGGDDHGVPAEELDPEVERHAVHSGAAAVPDADGAVAGDAAGGPGAGVPAPGRYGHPGRHAGAVGAGASAADAHARAEVLPAPQLANSIIGRLGHFIEPAIAPLGFNWKIGIGLISSVLAREVMVSTMGTLYGADPDTQALQPADRAAPRHDAGRRAGADDLLRLRHAVHVDHGGGAARDQQLEVAGVPVRLHAGAGL